MRGAFRFAVFPKQLISFNPMQYVTIRGNRDDCELFESGAEHTTATPVITDDQYKQLTEYLEQTQNPALLPIQIAYYTGLRLGEVCGLTWQDIDLDEQYLTVRRSICYNNVRKHTIIGPTKRKKIRTVDFCDTLAEILRAAKQEQKQGKLLANGAAPKDVQELLGHTDINTTLNVYAHATRESKRNSAMLLDATVSAV